MKLNSRGSILIWSIFLVIFISFSFLYISNQIGKEIERNNKKILESQVNSVLDNFDFSSKILSLSDNETLEVNFFWNFSSILASNEEINLSFSSSNTWSITIMNWWPIYYKVFTWSIVYSSWLVIDNKYDIWIYTGTNLTLTNLWWLSKVNLEFDSINWIKYPYNYISVKKNIWWSDLIKQVFKIK